MRPFRGRRFAATRALRTRRHRDILSTKSAPFPSRRSPAIVWRILSNNFAETRHLSSAGTEALLRLLRSTGAAGGAIYDALVAAAVVEHNLPLLTRDRRALDSYRVVGADVDWLA